MTQSAEMVTGQSHHCPLQVYLGNLYDALQASKIVHAIAVHFLQLQSSQILMSFKH